MSQGEVLFGIFKHMQMHIGNAIKKMLLGLAGLGSREFQTPIFIRSQKEEMSKRILAVKFER